MRVIVAITGATGAVYGVRFLEALTDLGAERHLIISTWGRRTIEHETGLLAADVNALATHVHPFRNQASVLSSGSFRCDAMVIAPCSMRTLGAIAHGIADNLIVRAAEVTLKERRRLVLLTRESPLTEIHLTNMLSLARMGVDIVPPAPAFYNHPRTIDDVVDHTVGRLLDLLGFDTDRVDRWTDHLQAPRPTASAP